MKILKTIFTLSLTFLLFTSCDLNDESVDNNGHDITGSPEIIGWDKTSVTESYFSDIGTIDKNYAVKVLNGKDAAAISKDVNFTITVDQDNTTANNDEYTLSTPSGTLFSGEQFEMYTVGINTGNFSSTISTKVTLNIEASTNGVVVSELSKKMEIQFVGCSSSLDKDGANNIINYQPSFDGGTYNDPQPLTKFDDVYYRVGYLPAFAGTYWMEFKDVCGELTITDWQYEGSYPIEQSAPGYIDGNGDIVFPSISVGDIDWFQNKQVKYIRN